MSVGMGVNLPAIQAVWPAVLLAALVIVIVKTVVVFAAARLNGWRLPGATQLGFLLSQGSEFTLVVVGIASIANAMPGTWSGVITAAVALTLVAAPIWTSLGLHIARLLAERSKSAAVDAAEVAEEHPVLVFGMTEEGRLAADALRDHGIPYLAIDSDAERFVSASSDGYTMVFGDANNRSLMENLAVGSAPAIVLGARGLGMPSAFAGAGNGSPAPPVFVAVTDTGERARQAGLGFRAHLSHAEPKGIELATDLLTSMGIAQDRIAIWVMDQADAHGLLDKTGEPVTEPEAA
jgi:TrkA-N domain/Sodium/hydrogen exchanger family